MGFFSLKVVCNVCEGDAGLNRYKIANKEHICSKCFKDAGFNRPNMLMKPITQYTPDEIRESIKKNSAVTEEITNFNATKVIGAEVEFDDNNKKWLVKSGIFKTKKNAQLFDYDDILDFELLDDGESIMQGGLGRALVGGALFGGVGAVVGGVTGKRKNKSICKSLKIKVTLKNINNPVVYINFIENDTKRDGFMYKIAFQNAQECLSVLQIICDVQQPGQTLKTEQPSSATEEIIKYKELMDQGIITQEEFEAKKKQLLGL